MSMTKYFVATLILVSLGLVSVVSNLPAEPVKGTAEELIKKLEGNWKILRLERDGKNLDLTQQRLKSAIFKATAKVLKTNKNTIIQGHHLQFTSDPGKAMEGDDLWFEIKPGTEPPGINLTIISARGFEPSHGIFTFKGDRLLMCWPDAKEFGEPLKRPTEFKTALDSKLTLYELERLPPPKPKPKQASDAAGTK